MDSAEGVAKGGISVVHGERSHRCVQSDTCDLLTRFGVPDPRRAVFRGGEDRTRQG